MLTDAYLIQEHLHEESNALSISDPPPQPFSIYECQSHVCGQKLTKGRKKRNFPNDTDLSSLTFLDIT